MQTKKTIFTRYFILSFLIFSGCGQAQSQVSTTANSTAAPAATPVVNARLKQELGECASSEISEAVPSTFLVNQHVLNPAESKNLVWIRNCILPFLPGEMADRLDTIAKVTWWSLREGVLELTGNKLFRYSLCNDKSGHDRDRSATPLYDCETNIWQVGVAAGQVMNYSTAEIDEKSNLIVSNLTSDGSITENDLLDWTATLAGFDAGTPEYAGILNSTNRVRRSWMVRNPLVGMLLTQTEVNDECIKEGKSWCFNGSYAEAVKFSGNRSNMLNSIEDIKKILSPQ